MRKVICLMTVLLLCASLIMPAFAAEEEGFVPSITYKPVPEIVPVQGEDGKGYIGVIRNAEGEIIDYVEAGCLRITPVAHLWDEEIEIPEDIDYFYICENNTIYGTHYNELPHFGDIPVVAEMSSCILSEEVDVTKFGVIYAGAQKNLAPAGVTIAIVKESALGQVERAIPTMLDYRTHIKKGSMFNTPPVLPIFSALQTLKYYKSLGGVAAIEKVDIEKAAKYYDAID